MRKILPKLSYLFIVIFFLFFSCSKSNLNAPAPSNLPTSVVVHKYGLNPMTEDQWKDVPVFSSAIFQSGATDLGLVYAGKFPSNYLLATPAVRDQGQMGACTGFCGSEAD